VRHRPLARPGLRREEKADGLAGAGLPVSRSGYGLAWSLLRTAGERHDLSHPARPSTRGIEGAGLAAWPSAVEAYLHVPGRVSARGRADRTILASLRRPLP